MAWREGEPDDTPRYGGTAWYGATPRRPVEEITGHEETYPPKALSAAPGTPEFHTGLAAHLCGLGV